MGLLYASELRDPSEWVLQNAQCILDSVKQAGGWMTLFPLGPPMWLHKIRNYFNVEPTTLRLLDKGETDRWMALIRTHGKLNAFIKGPRTLSGHVYCDSNVVVWYQMGPGGTIYHWGRKVVIDWAEAAYAHQVRGQSGIPVFKLVCPDGTGGSKETIIKNPKIHKVPVRTSQGDYFEMQRGTKIGETNEVNLVKTNIVTDEHHQGSYNFAETAVVGLKAHEKYDVDMHKKDEIYFDPPDRFAPLADRLFTEYVLIAAGANTKKTSTDVSRDFDEPPRRRKPHSVSI